MSVSSQNLAPLAGTLMTPAKCEPNITAQTGLTASMFCCLGTNNKDLGVSKWAKFIQSQQSILISMCFCNWLRYLLWKHFTMDLFQ